LNAFKALGRIGGEQVIKYIISIAINTRAPMWDSIFATRVLGEIGNAESAKPILKCLKQYINKNELAYGSRVPEFCMTLAKLNEKQAGELVLEAWKRSDSHNDPKPYIIALGLIGDERAVGYISNCIGNKIPDILEKDTSVCGLEALSKIGTKHAIDKLKHFARIYATSNTPEVIFTTLANELRNHGDYEWLIDELITYGLSEHTKSGFGSSGRIVTKLEWITGENLGGKINNWSEWWKENKKLNASITS
jgi:hypothetical protein